MINPSACTFPDLQRAAQAAGEADAALARAAYAAAEGLYTEALAIYATRLRACRAEVGHCRLGLGRVRDAQGRFTEARALVEGALAVLPGGQPDKAAAHHALGEILSNQEDLPGGIQHLQRAYRLRCKLFGGDGPDTLNSASLLALLEWINGETKAGRLRMAKAVHLADARLGEPDVSIAKVYHHQGRIWLNEAGFNAQARAMIERALAIFERCEGPNHPDVGVALNNLAILANNQKDWASGASLLERALALHEHVYGPRSPFSISILANLADTHKNLGRLASAYRYAARAVCIAVRGLGPRSPQTLRVLHKLNLVQVARSKAGDPDAMQEAIPFHQCLVALEVATGKRDPAKEITPGARLDPEKAAARLQSLIPRLEAELERPARSEAEQVAYERDLMAARSLLDGADQAMQRQEIEAAHELYRQALAAYEALPGDRPLHLVPILEKLTQTYDTLGQPSAVLPLLERILAIQSAELGPAHPNAILALTRVQQRTAYEYGKEASLPLLARIQELQAESLGPDEPLAKMSRNALERIRQWIETTGPTPPGPRGPSRSERYEAALAEALAHPAPLLDGLEEVDWVHLCHAYGPAIDTPRHLRLLLSADETVRDAAWEALGSSIYHQGTVYPATAACVPFLIRLLDQHNPPGQRQVLNFLAALAAGHSYLETHARPGGLNADWNAILAKMGRGDLESETRNELEVVAQINRAVAAGLPRYLALLDDPELCPPVLLVLSSLAGCADEVAPQIAARLARFGDPHLHAAALGMLRSLLDHSPEALALFTRELSNQDADPRIIFQSAAGVIERAEAAAPQPVVEALFTAWAPAQQLSASLRREFFELSALIDTRLNVLAHLGAERGAPALLQILPQVTDPQTVLDLAGLLLELVFHPDSLRTTPNPKRLRIRFQHHLRSVQYEVPSPTPRAPDSLAPAQRAVLKHLLDLPAFWELQHNLLEVYGLPAGREELRAFLAQSEEV